MQSLRIPLVLLTAVGACSAPRGPDSAMSETILTATEIRESGAQSAHDAIRRLRPAWLQNVDRERLIPLVRAGDPSPSLPSRCAFQAFIDARGIAMEELRRIEVGQIAEIREIRPGQTRPDGSTCSHRNSAIHVRLTGSQ